jgi:hypothetical protein
MSQPEESRPKTDKIDDVLLRPDEDPLRRIDQIPPRDKEHQGEVLVEHDDVLRPPDKAAELALPHEDAERSNE